MNTIEETIKLAGFGRKKAMKKQIEVFEKELLKGEQLLGVAASTPNTTEQLYITNKRVIAHRIEGVLKNNRIDIPITSISSINTILKGFGASIEIVASDNKATIEKTHIHVAQEIKRLIDSLILPSVTEQVAQASSDDVVNQIKMLAELHKSGVLTEEELNAKKKQLLGI